MTGDGHSKDALMLTEVTKLVIRWNDAGAGPARPHSIHVCLDLLTAHPYARASDNEEKRVPHIAHRKMVRRLIVQGQAQQTWRSG
jgi:hypothetical protein